MWGTGRASEILNRGATAAAMTMAIAIVYGTVATQKPMAMGDNFSQQVQTILGLDDARQQDPAAAQESLVTLLRYSPGSDYSR